MAQIGGRLDINTIPGKGLTYTVELPLDEVADNIISISISNSFALAVLNNYCKYK